MQIGECISSAEKVFQQAERESNPYKRNVLLEIARLFQRLAEAERLAPLTRRMAQRLTNNRGRHT